MRRSNRMKRILGEQWAHFLRPRSNGDGEATPWIAAPARARPSTVARSLMKSDDPYSSMIPRLSPITAACVRSSVPSFERMFRTWLLTASSVTESLAAISLFV